MKGAATPSQAHPRAVDDHRSADRIMRRLCTMRAHIEALPDNDFKRSILIMIDEYDPAGKAQQRIKFQKGNEVIA